MAVNPMIPGFDPGMTGRPVASNGNPTVTSSEPEDKVGASVDPYERMAQMRKQGLGSTAMGPIVAGQVSFGQGSPLTQAAPEQPVAPPSTPEQPAVEPQPARPIVVKEPVSEEMREMIANMRRAGVEIPEPPGPPPPAAAPVVEQAASPPAPEPVVSEQAPPEVSVQSQVPQPVSQDPWARLEEMRRKGMGSTPVSGFASQQLGLQSPSTAEPVPPIAPPQPAPEPAVQSSAAVTQPPETVSETVAPPSLQENREIPRPLKEPVTGDMAQMLEDMRANGVLPPETTQEQVSQAPSSPTPADAVAAPASQPAASEPKDPYVLMEQMRQQGLGSTQAGSFARTQINLEEFDRQHPAPPPQEFEIAPPPRSEEPVIAPGGQNRVFDGFQVPPPSPRSDWWGQWGDFGKASQPAPQAPPSSSQPGDGWFGQWGDFGSAPSQSASAATPAPPQPSSSWFGQWGDFGAAPAQTAAPGPAPASQQPASNQWWGRWGDFAPGPAPTPPVQPQSYADDWQQMGGFQAHQPNSRPQQQAYYDPRQAYYDPYQGYSGIQMPYQPHPGSLPPSMQSYGQFQQQPWQQMQMPPMGMPPMNNAPMWSMMSLMPAISMISMLPMMMMPMMMMPMMMTPFMFGGFGF
ncbi:MAG: hypothetical protein AMXMBFR33_14280 [Candidatus Xenobia bacterium]